MNKYRPLKLPKESKFQIGFENNIAELTILKINNKPFPNQYEQPKLYQWMSMIRNVRRNGKLHADNIERLDRIGFSWNLRLTNWQDHYSSLKRLLYKGIYPKGNAKYEKKLVWILAQLAYYDQGELLPSECEQWESLDECTFLATSIYPIEQNKGLSEDELEQRWNNNFEELVHFVNSPNDKWPKPSTYHYKNMTRYRWFSKQLEDKANGCMSDKHTAKWNTLCYIPAFSANDTEEDWMARFEHIKENYLLKLQRVYKSDKYYKWCKWQYDNFESLSEERQKLLNTICFKTYFMETDWEVKYRWLKDFVKRNKAIPTSRKNNSLAVWLHFQRMRIKANKLVTSKKNLILAIDKKYGRKYTDEQRWHTQFEDVASFVVENNFWPRAYATEGREYKLHNWCQTQRKRHSKSHHPFTPLKQDKVDLLDGIGIRWSDNNASALRWKNYFNRLESYIKTTGNNVIPKIVAGKKFPLYRWLTAQKKATRNGSLTTERVNMLTALAVL